MNYLERISKNTEEKELEGIKRQVKNAERDSKRSILYIEEKIDELEDRLEFSKNATPLDFNLLIAISKDLASFKEGLAAAKSLQSELFNSNIPAE